MKSSITLSYGSCIFISDPWKPLALWLCLPSDNGAAFNEPEHRAALINGSVLQWIAGAGRALGASQAKGFHQPSPETQPSTQPSQQAVICLGEIRDNHVPNTAWDTPAPCSILPCHPHVLE